MFDGDEMNIAFLVNTQNIEFAKICCTIDFRMTNLNDNSMVLKPNHDTPYGIYIFTKYLLEKDFTRDHALFLLQRTQINEILPLQATYKGKQIITYVLTEKMYKYLKDIDTKPITNKILGEMFLDYYYVNGPIQTKQFIQNIQCFAFAVVVYHATTLTLNDCYSSYDFQQMALQFIESEKEIQVDVIQQYLKNTGQDMYQYQGEEVIQKSMAFISSREDDIFKTFSNDNSYANMLRSGSKGKKTHMISLQHLGIQMEGQNLFNKGDHNRYCAYHTNRIGYRENNCIFDGLYGGMNSQSDYISVNAFARLGFVTQKVKTAKPGYINRRIDQFCSPVSVSYHNTMMVNNQLLLSTVFAGNGIDIKYQRRQTIDLIKCNNKQIKDLFLDSNRSYDRVIQLRDKMRYAMVYSQSIYKLQTTFCHPIDYDFILHMSKQQTSGTVLVNTKIYENMINHLIQNLNIVQHDRIINPEMVTLDEGFKILLELFVYNGLTLKKLIDNKITVDQLVFIYNEIIDQYEKYKVNPGEYVGLQCSQAFCKDVTQKSIDVFHKVSAEKQQYQIDHLNQLDKFITKGENITPLFIVRFKKEFSKNLKMFEEFKNLMMKKVLKDITLGYNIGFDRFPKSKYLSIMKDYYTDDILKVNISQQQINFLTAFDIDDFDIKFVTFMELELNTKKMQEMDLDINQVQYGICHYLKNNIQDKNISAVVMQSNIYCLYDKTQSKIQLRFYAQEVISPNLISLISNFAQFIIQDININYQFQDSQIDQVFVEKRDFYEFDDLGNIIHDFEYVLTILSEVKSFHFLQNYICVDYNRCVYNDVKNLEQYTSIVTMQRILYQLIQDSSIALIGDGQLPQNIQIIVQMMCHNKYIIPFTRSAIKNVYGSDTLYAAFFETQFTSMVDGALNERHGNALNNYTSYFLTSTAKVGPEKSQLLIINNKKEVLQKKIVKIEIPMFYYNMQNFPKEELCTLIDCDL